MKLELTPCPFCGEKPEILICDDEGNIHAGGYEQDAWLGLGYVLRHCIDEAGDDNEACPIATFMDESIGTQIYDSREEAIKRWNKRFNP